jgi:hypothetical protein
LVWAWRVAMSTGDVGCQPPRSPAWPAQGNRGRWKRRRRAVALPSQPVWRSAVQVFAALRHRFMEVPLESRSKPLTERLLDVRSVADGDRARCAANAQSSHFDTLFGYHN